MAAPITPIQLSDPSSILPITGLNSPAASAGAGAVFHDVFNTAINTVESFQTQADKAVQDLLSGANEDVHTPVIATQKADLSFQLFMQVRNKVISAYQTVMGMQV